MNKKGWTICYTSKADKAFLRLDKSIQQKIRKFLDKTLFTYEHPTKIGSPLSGPFKGLWRYRVGDYRIVCEIKNNELVVLVVYLAHRKEVYKTIELH